MLLKIQFYCQRVISLVVLLIITCSVCHADVNKINANIALKSEHTDNIYTSNNAKVDDFIFTASPKLTVLNSDGRFSSKLSGALNIIEYNDHRDLSAVDDDYSGSFIFKVTPRLSLQSDGQYLKNSRPDYFIEDSGFVISKKIEKSRASAKSDFFISESLFLSAGYNHENFDYRESDREGTETNSSSIMIGNDLSGIISNLTSRITIESSNSSFSGLEINILSSFAGFTKQINEKLSFSIDAGLSNIESDFDRMAIVFDPLPTEVDTDDECLEWLAFSALEYKGELSLVRLSLSRTVTPAPERSGAVNRLSSSFNAEKRLSEDLTFFTTFLYHLNESPKGQYSISEIEEETYQVRPGIKYIINRYFKCEAAYRYSHNKNKITGDEATQNIFYLNLWIDYPFFE